MTDPRNDPRLSDPVSSSGKWGWIAGIAVLALIAIILIAGWNNETNTANNAPPATAGSVTAPVPPASTTGSAPASQPATSPALAPSKQ